MKPTRFLSLLLAVLMIVSTVCLTSCGDSEDSGDTTNTSTREIIALNMYILTNDETDPEAAKAVQMEINRLLLPNHKTILKINYLKADEYWPVVEEMLEKTDPANSTSTSLITSNASVVGTEGMNFTQMVEYFYDKNTTDVQLTQDQIDIFVVNDFEKYEELANNDKLMGLGQYLTYDSKILTTTIHPTFMSAAKLGTETYGIPTNIGVDAGEYTYLIFDKELLEECEVNVADIRVFSDNRLFKFLEKVKADHPEIWPLSEPFDIAGAEYYDDSFIVKNLEFNKIGNDCKPVFMFNDYNSNRAVAERYEQLGFFPKEGEAGEDAKYAIRVERSTELLCDPEDKEWKEDGRTYVRLLFDIPRVEIDEAFSSVMCVSATSPVPERAMEIITLFQTDAEYANLLQYGINGVNYQVNKLDNTITILEDSKYSMDNIITGNTFIKYPENNDKKYVERAIRSNLTAAPSAFLGFNLNFEGADESQYEATRTIVNSGVASYENDTVDYETARKIINTELTLLGYATVGEGTSELAGIYGKVQKAQQQLAAPIEKQLALHEDILNYNAPYGIILKQNVFLMDAPKDETPAEGEAGDEALDGETDGGEAVDGEAVDGEATGNEAVDSEVSGDEAVETEAAEPEEEVAA